MAIPPWRRSVLVTMLILMATSGCVSMTARWPVKVGDDPDAGEVDLAHPVATDIKTLDALPAPPHHPDARRVNSTERTVYVVDAYITDYKLAISDGDYHLALSDEQGHRMIAEIPAPSHLKSGNPFRERVKAARDAVEDRLHPSIVWRHRQHIHVRVTGVGFFDLKHDQFGMAPDNAIELHPVLDIKFLD